MLAAVSRANGGEKVVTLGFVSLFVFSDFFIIGVLGGIQLEYSGACVRVHNTNIENKGEVSRRQSDKDSSLVIAGSVLGHN